MTLVVSLVSVSVSNKKALILLYNALTLVVSLVSVSVSNKKALILLYNALTLVVSLVSTKYDDILALYPVFHAVNIGSDSTKSVDQLIINPEELIYAKAEEFVVNPLGFEK